MKQQADIICKLKQEAGLPISDDFLYDEFGIPKPDNYDELKAEQRAARQIIPSTTSSQTSSQKKEDDQEDEDPDDGKKRSRSIRDALRSFFGRAPEDSGADLDW